MKQAFTISLIAIAATFSYGGLITYNPQRLGPDYSMWIPRFLEGILFFRNQGLTSPLYSPLFCGGSPSYANPQSAFYSLPQFLCLIMEPLMAIKCSIFIYMITSVLGMWKLSRHLLKLKYSDCIITSLSFVGSGYVLAHMLVGHLNYLPFLLLPFIIYLIFCPNSLVCWPALLLSIILASLVYSGSHTIPIVFSISLPIIWAALELVNAKKASPLVIFKRLLIGLIGAFCLSLSKIIAVLSFMRFFPRLAGYADMNWLDAILIPFQQLLFGAIFWYGDFQGEGDYWWEQYCMINPIMLLACIFVLFNRYLERKIIVLIAFLLACLPFYLFFLGASFLREWPILSALRINTRLTAACILPVIIMSSEWLKATKIRPSLLLLSAVIPILILIPASESYLRSGDALPVSAKEIDLAKSVAMAS